MTFLNGNVPSSKNSKVMGRFFSKQVMNYLKDIGVKEFSSTKKTFTTLPNRRNLILELKPLFDNIQAPYIISFHFVRGNKHKFDFNNVTQILLDLFTAHNLIEDDNMDFIEVRIMRDKDGKKYTVDKNRPGVYIKVETDKLTK